MGGQATLFSTAYQEQVNREIVEEYNLKVLSYFGVWCVGVNGVDTTP